MISRQEALLRVDAASLLELLHPRIDPGAVRDYEILGRGFAASPGAAVGEIVLDADEARKKRQAGEPAVLVAGSPGPDDKEGMLAAGALVTGPEGLSSHDLVVLRGAGTPIVRGCEGMEVDVERGEVRFGERKVEAGEVVTVDGSGGTILFGEAPVFGPATGGDLEELLSWADGVRRLSVRANADTVEGPAVRRRGRGPVPDRANVREERAPWNGAAHDPD